MRTSDFWYELPQELIAQTPVEPRDSSRMLVYNRLRKDIEHRIFKDITDYLKPGDVLVTNETKVIPARLIGKREDTGGAIEFLLLKRLTANRWETLVKPGRRAVPGRDFIFGEVNNAHCLRAQVISKTPENGRIVEFSYDGVFEEHLDALGKMPLPPYIHEQLEEKGRYQTVYAKTEGSAAAPTAGLHFTDELLDRIKDMGIDIVPVLLHVGLGTFRPVKSDDVETHKMHSEEWEISGSAATRINEARMSGGRIICVGTTTVRTLETAAKDGVVKEGRGTTDIFIYPGYKFQMVDGLITNFHLPESTLLMLVSAFMGKEEALSMYATAVRERYRFFSFGDAMLILCSREGKWEN